MRRASPLLPWLALGLTLLIWASYLVAARYGAVNSLAPLDLAFLRAGPAFLCLLPVLIWRWRDLGPIRPLDILILGGLGGCGFSILLPLGLSYAPVADSGVFTPSMLPVFVAILSAIFLGTRHGGHQIVGFGLILTGALAIGGAEALLRASGGAWRGHLLFLAASLAWAGFTVRFRVSGLDALTATVIVLGTASLVFAAALFSAGTGLGDVDGRMLWLQIGQGVASGLVANFTYFTAIRHLGPARPAASAALVPILAALGAWMFLAEPLGWVKVIGICVTCLGIVLASGVFGRGLER